MEQGVMLNVMNDEQVLTLAQIVADKVLEAQKQKDEQSKYMTVKEACEFFKIDRTSLWRWERDGYIKTAMIGHKKFYIKQAMPV